MAYAAVISLMNTIKRLVYSSHISLVPPWAETIKVAYLELESLKEIRKILDSNSKSRSRKRKRVNALDRKIRQVVSKFEDSLESHVLELTASQSESSLGGESHPLWFSTDLRNLRGYVDSFIEKVKKMRKKYFNELRNPLPEEEEEDAVPSTLDFGGEKSKMVGLYAEFSEIREFIQVAYELESLEEILKRLDSTSKSRSRKRVNALDGNIREVVSKFEDSLESHVSDQIASQSESRRGGESHPLLFSIDLRNLRGDVDSFIEKVIKMEEEYVDELCNPLPEEDDDDVVPSTLDFGGKKSKMVGLSTELSYIRWRLTHNSGVLSLFGMAGIGKTTLAKEIFEDPLLLSHFDYRVWVTVGRKCQLNEILRRILALVDTNTEQTLIEGDEKIAEHLKEILAVKKYLIVLDDVWNIQGSDYLKSCVLDRSGRSRILLTTRLREVCDSRIFSTAWAICPIGLLNEEESWNLLCEKVFGEELCPFQLEEAGRKIAQICEGLPLTIVTVADFLSKAEKTPEYWNKVAEKRNSVFKDAFDKISKVLFPSYDYLPQHLKPLFLYMGVFPLNYEIPLSRLINMCNAEGFLETNTTQTSEQFAKKYLSELIRNSLVICCHKSICWVYPEPYMIKTCRLHSSWWHLVHREAGMNKFFHVLNSRANGLESQRRLCTYNNILLGIKDMYNSIKNDWASTARSLLCFGPYHQYQVPICFGLSLLRVLDAIKIRFYEFPVEVLKLVQLRYLALTYNGKLPASISNLWNLQFLIIHRHMSIKSCGAPSDVPIEIWDMQELKHIQIVGSDLPNSNWPGSLKNLSTLLDVSARSCTTEVLERIPYLEKLRIQIELVPDDASIPFHCLDCIFHLRKLKSLKCVVVNPELRSEFVAPPAPPSMFPLSLQKLHLSGLGYPWEYMDIIASLPKLRVLKLRCYAFRGPKWETKENRFASLEYFLIEDTDLVQLTIEGETFPRLRRLTIKNCYKLQEVHREYNSYRHQLLQVVDCTPLTVTSANQPLHVCVHSSWEDGKLKS